MLEKNYTQNELEQLWEEAKELLAVDESGGFGSFLKLCEIGYPRAAHSVAWCYRYGKGVQTDREKAKEYYSLAIERGNDKSYTALFSMLDEEGRASDSYEMAVKGAKGGSSGCYGYLAMECMIGNLYGGNSRVAAFLAARAYELDKANGNFLGYCYMDGRYLPRVYPYAKYCIENSDTSRELLEECGMEFPDFWDEIEARPPKYPDFGLTLDDCVGLADPVLQFEEAQQLFYGDNPDEKRGKELLLASVEGGYAEAMYRMFLKDMPDYEKWLILGADGYGEVRCIETLAALFTDSATFIVGDPFLNNAVHFWTLRKRLHSHIPVDELVIEQYNAFNTGFANMMKGYARPAPKEQSNAVLLCADGTYKKITVDFSTLQGLYAPLGCDRINAISTRGTKELSHKLGFTLVMYCDERGMMKKLGENRTAAMLSGYDVIFGDVVICGFDKDYSPLSEDEVELVCDLLGEM